MRVGLKTSVAFSVAAAFLLTGEIAADVVVDYLNERLAETSHYNEQLGKAITALREIRLHSDESPDTHRTGQLLKRETGNAWR